jgi:hypothetical protein
MSGTLGTIYDDGDYTVIQPCSLPELSAPIPTDTTRYILTQDFQQAEANYTPLALNTAYPNTEGSSAGADFKGADTYYNAGFILVGEGPLRDMGAGVVQWTRRYARLPNSHAEATQVSYQFPGFLLFDPLETLIRNPFTRLVPGVKKYDYFLAGTNTDTAVRAVETANWVTEQQYLWPRTFEFAVPNEALRVDYLWDATTPTLFQYGTMVSSGTQTIVPYPSQFSLWEGLIIRREVITILPV